MSFAASVAVRMANRIERAGGPRAGLAVWKALAERSMSGEAHGTVLLAAFRCAVALRDPTALEELSTRWGDVSGEAWGAQIAALCVEMTRAGLLSRAVALARVESQRSRTSYALYTYSRCLDVARDQAAVGAFRETIESAEDEGAKVIEVAARVRLAVLLCRSVDTVPAAVDEARRVELTCLSPSSRLAVARVLLHSPSRFTRASAIGIVDEIVCGDDAALSARAIEITARWVDDVREELTPLEFDRLVALFGRPRAVSIAPQAKVVMRSIERVVRAKGDAQLEEAIEHASSVDPSLGPLHERARDILRGRFEVARDPIGDVPDDPARRHVFRHEQILDVVVAMRDRLLAQAARSLRWLAEAEEAGERLPREVLGVAHVAFGEEGDELRDVAARLVAAYLRRSSPAPPPRGFVALADTLMSIGEDDLSLRARRAAVLVNEPGARESLGVHLARIGWRLALHEPPEREASIRMLREAKSLLTKS